MTAHKQHFCPFIESVQESANFKMSYLMMHSCYHFDVNQDIYPMSCTEIVTYALVKKRMGAQRRTA